MTRRFLLAMSLVLALAACNLRGGPRKPGLLHTHTPFCTIVADLYGSSHADLLYLESYEVDPAEMGLYFFVQFHTGGRTHVKDVLVWRTEFHRSWVEVFTRAELDIHVLYVDLPGEPRLGPPYGRAYGFRSKKGSEIDLVDADVFSLWQMRVLVGYYGYTPAEVAAMGPMGAWKFSERVTSVHDKRARGAAAREERGKPVKAPAPDEEEKGPPAKAPGGEAKGKPDEAGGKPGEAKGNDAGAKEKGPDGDKGKPDGKGKSGDKDKPGKDKKKP